MKYYYSGLSNEVYNVSASQGARKIPAMKVRRIEKPSYLPYKTEVYLCPQTLTAGIFWAPWDAETLYTSFERPE